MNTSSTEKKKLPWKLNYCGEIKKMSSTVFPRVGGKTTIACEIEFPIVIFGDDPLSGEILHVGDNASIATVIGTPLAKPVYTSYIKAISSKRNNSETHYPMHSNCKLGAGFFIGIALGIRNISHYAIYRITEFVNPNPDADANTPVFGHAKCALVASAQEELFKPITFTEFPQQQINTDITSGIENMAAALSYKFKFPFDPFSIYVEHIRGITKKDASKINKRFTELKPQLIKLFDDQLPNIDIHEMSSSLVGMHEMSRTYYHQLKINGVTNEDNAYCLLRSGQTDKNQTYIEFITFDCTELTGNTLIDGQLDARIITCFRMYGAPAKIQAELFSTWKRTYAMTLWPKNIPFDKLFVLRKMIVTGSK